MNKNINISKTETSNQNIPKEDKIAVNKNEMRQLFLVFDCPSNEFENETAIEEIRKYSFNHKRIFYSTISSIIYKNNSQEGNHQNGDILTNLESLVNYLESNKDIPNRKEIKQIAWKILDHVNLANQQFTSLAESDSDFQRRFKESINQSTVELRKDMNGQLLSLVSIFTALAFLLFGGISSLESIFGNISKTSLLSLLILSIVWAFGLTNVIFVFLYCIGKMTKLPFKVTNDTGANFVQRYPVICWVDFILLFLFVLFSWTYILNDQALFQNVYYWMFNHSMICMIGGYILIILVSALIFWKMLKAK